MNVALYILLALAVVAAIAMQVWILRSAEQSGAQNRAVTFLRVLNIVLLVAAVAIALVWFLRR